MTTTQQQKKGSKFLHTVEWLGNMLPHPVTLFMIFIVLLGYPDYRVETGL